MTLMSGESTNSLRGTGQKWGQDVTFAFMEVGLVFTLMDPLGSTCQCHLKENNEWLQYNSQLLVPWTLVYDSLAQELTPMMPVADAWAISRRNESEWYHHET